MQIEFDTENVYCKPTDVERYFQGLESNNGFTKDTTPTATQVNRMIEEWSAYIDRQCGHSWRNNKVKDEIHDLWTVQLLDGPTDQVGQTRYQDSP